MTSRRRYASLACLLLLLPAVSESQRPAGAVRQEREQAAREVPQLAELLALKPGMTVADVGAGGGAMSVVMAKWLGPEGRVYATDVRAEQLAEIRAAVAQDALSNVWCWKAPSLRPTFPANVVTRSSSATSTII